MARAAAKLRSVPPVAPVPGVSVGEIWFPADETTDAAALHKTLMERLTGLRDRAEVDPFGDPILMLALDLTRMMDKGDVSPSAVEHLVQHLTARSFQARSARLAAYVGEIDPAANDAKLEALLRGVAEGQSFEAFADKVQALHYGIVFTAHPTFSTSLELSRAMAALATGQDADGVPLTEAGKQALMEAITRADHRPPRSLTLSVEHRWCLEALENAQSALERLHALVLRLTKELYPDRWTELSPGLVSLATWVGYDHDGRADITWADTLRLRLIVKQAQVQRHRRTLAGLIAEAGNGATATVLELLESLLALAEKQVTDQIAAALLANQSLEDAQRFAFTLVQDTETALVDATRLVALAGRALEQNLSEGGALAERLSVLKASLALHGLGAGHSHFRLNSTQLHNAIRRQVGLETGPEDPAHRRSYYNAINDLMERAQPVSINIGSLLAEQASAKRMFMMIAELAKAIDRETPIRFLIAETESAFTLLTALYYAKLFGLEDQIEISPLFETVYALEHGDQIIEDALRSPHYRAYVQKSGKLCIQFGYSDSGRYIGQLAATFHIERLRLRLAAVLQRAGLAGVQVVLFNTHGESIGRGGHPLSLTDRLHYLAPPFSRSEFTNNGIAVKEESSFQGGDGYLIFQSPDLAYAAVARIVEATLVPSPEAENDPIYGQGDFSTEFFAAVKQFFGELVDDPNYAALLGVYGTAMLYRTGSRPVKRQSEAWGRVPDLSHPSQLRAIPNNGVLQQLGLLANTIGGLGRAMSKDPDLAAALLKSSPRFRRAMALVEHGMSVSDLDVMRAYLDTLDPGMWLHRSGRTKLPTRREELRVLARHLERLDSHHRLAKVFRKLQADFLALRDTLAYCRAQGLDVPPVGLGETERNDLVLLHAIRVALIHRIFLLATHIPDFSPQHGTTFEEMFARVLHLDLEPVLDFLADVFPARPDADAPTALDFGEPATYRGGVGQTYEAEHERLFRPMRGYFELIRRIGTAITYQIGAVG